VGFKKTGSARDQRNKVETGVLLVEDCCGCDGGGGGGG